MARVRAVLDGLLAGFRGAFLNAVREVEDALVLERFEEERIARLSEELAFAKQLLDETRARYVEGLGDYLPVINAVQAKQRAERNLLAAQRLRLSYRIQLYRALGGSWIDAVPTQGGSGEKS